MDTVAGVKAERDVIESELKNTDSDSVRARLIAAFQQGNHHDENSVVVNEIESIYTPLRQQVNETVSKQEQLVENIRTANLQFQNEKQGNSSSEMREEMLKNLARAYDAYQELVSNLKEGTKVCFILIHLLLINIMSSSFTMILHPYYLNFKIKYPILSSHVKQKKTI